MIRSILLIFFLTVAAHAQFYVSPTGNDSANGLTPATAFLTLGKCQTAMRSGAKTCNILTGTYTFGADLDFTSADNGETWQNYQCGVPVIDGATTHNIFMSFDGSTVNGITFSGLTFQRFNPAIVGGQAGTFIGYNSLNITWDHNTFINCQLQCIDLQFYQQGGGSGSGIAITNNTVNGQQGTEDTSLGNNFAFELNAPTGAVVRHNLFRNLEGGAVQMHFGGTGTGSQPVNNAIDSNLVNGALQGTWCGPGSNPWDCGDSGVLYYAGGSCDDPAFPSMGGCGGPQYFGSNNSITNNVMLNIDLNPASNNFLKGIYLDDNMSFVTVSGNITQIGKGNGIHIHGGNNITIQNNIWDMSATVAGAANGLVYYQGSSPAYGMANNTFNQNLAYTSGSASGLTLWANNGGESNPTSRNNLYYAQIGGSWPQPSGGVSDLSPVYQNPLFANPASGNYAMPGTSPAFTVLSPPFAALPTNQGPLPSSCGGARGIAVVY